MNRETSRRLSPMNLADRSCTPTLILQGEADERCPKCQAEELYVTLMCSGDTPVELVLYPGGSHHFFEDGTPSHRVDATRRLVEWVERWIDVVPAKPQVPGEAETRPSESETPVAAEAQAR